MRREKDLAIMVSRMSLVVFRKALSQVFPKLQ